MLDEYIWGLIKTCGFRSTVRGTCVSRNRPAGINIIFLSNGITFPDYIVARDNKSLQQKQSRDPRPRGWKHWARRMNERWMWSERGTRGRYLLRNSARRDARRTRTEDSGRGGGRGRGRAPQAYGAVSPVPNLHVPLLHSALNFSPKGGRTQFEQGCCSVLSPYVVCSKGWTPSSYTSRWLLLLPPSLPPCPPSQERVNAELSVGRLIRARRSLPLGTGPVFAPRHHTEGLLGFPEGCVNC